MEQRRNERVGETEEPREIPPTNGIVRHDSHIFVADGILRRKNYVFKNVYETMIAASELKLHAVLLCCGWPGRNRGASDVAVCPPDIDVEVKLGTDTKRTTAAQQSELRMKYSDTLHLARKRTRFLAGRTCVFITVATFVDSGQLHARKIHIASRTQPADPAYPRARRACRASFGPHHAQKKKFEIHEVINELVQDFYFFRNELMRAFAVMTWDKQTHGIQTAGQVYVLFATSGYEFQSSDQVTLPLPFGVRDRRWYLIASVEGRGKVTSGKAADEGQRLECPSPAKVSMARFPAESLSDFHTWVSCRKMRLIGGFSRGFPVSLALAFERCFVSTSFHPHRHSRHLLLRARDEGLKIRLCTPLYEPGSTIQSRAKTYWNIDVAQTPSTGAEGGRLAYQETRQRQSEAEGADESGGSGGAPRWVSDQRRSRHWVCHRRESNSQTQPPISSSDVIPTQNMTPRNTEYMDFLHMRVPPAKLSPLPHASFSFIRAHPRISRDNLRLSARLRGCMDLHHTSLYNLNCIHYAADCVLFGPVTDVTYSTRSFRYLRADSVGRLRNVIRIHEEHRGYWEFFVIDICSPFLQQTTPLPNLTRKPNHDMNITIGGNIYCRAHFKLRVASNADVTVIEWMTVSPDRCVNKVMRPIAMLILHRVEGYTTYIQVELKDGYQKCSFYRKQPIAAKRQRFVRSCSVHGDGSAFYVIRLLHGLFFLTDLHSYWELQFERGPATDELWSTLSVEILRACEGKTWRKWSSGGMNGREFT
ncbi:hypothetical protein PR048_002815 [Dryococelus australis]|uniref:Uncharacterized protein n=1 Tax=Dryococelus australis TaxID=614101 RepID=A0ABQ9ILB4_9NEOP|nr:hypothetical protein PR048_002815 [Dryococelus australis]